MASAVLSKELECPVCLNIYTDPVTLRCGHNFCRVCIDRVLDSQEVSGDYSCPECREEFMERPELQTNIALRNVSEHVLSTQQDQDEAGILCTYCMHCPVPAIMSCLLCEASLCDNHLKVHSKAPEHFLCAPTTSLENRKCSVHKKILEYYCTEDAACVCVSCYVIGGHVGHKMLSLDEASEKKKKKLRNVLQKRMAETKKAEEKVQSLEERRRKAQKKADGEAERVTVLFKDLRKRLEDLEKRALSDIAIQAEQVVKSYDDVIRQLEIKKKVLSKKIRHIKKLCKTTDPLIVLQESDTGDLCDTEEGDEDSESDTGDLCDTDEGEDDSESDAGDLCDTEEEDEDSESDTGDLYDTENWERHDKQLYNGGDLDVASISQTLHTGLTDITSEVTGGIYIQPADILLDVTTSGDNLRIEDDRKTAWYSERWTYYDETPERFHESPQAISSQSFSSGRHYWEVDVSKSSNWRVGMCYPSIAREGNELQIGCNNNSWGLCGYEYNNKYYVRHDCKKIRLPDKTPRDTVRIYLDYDAGQISFYDLCGRGPTRHLHTFNATFTEPLHAVLCVEDGKIKISGGSQGV
ncbi:E3 ubiquitin/ISG15 ligase TRIM25-like [Hyperolius riggenbachi]|uniref:E3 ubiquitin/ISG15 ligase TRIM25-like n=1 Tax=Hyperolius riggenbachi TaxID=752182 RepID=UPI0035A3CF65